MSSVASMPSHALTKLFVVATSAWPVAATIASSPPHIPPNPPPSPLLPGCQTNIQWRVNQNDAPRNANLVHAVIFSFAILYTAELVFTIIGVAVYLSTNKNPRVGDIVRTTRGYWSKFVQRPWTIFYIVLLIVLIVAMPIVILFLEPWNCCDNQCRTGSTCSKKVTDCSLLWETSENLPYLCFQDTSQDVYDCRAFLQQGSEIFRNDVLGTDSVYIFPWWRLTAQNGPRLWFPFAYIGLMAAVLLLGPIVRGAAGFVGKYFGCTLCSMPSSTTAESVSKMGQAGQAGQADPNGQPGTSVAASATDEGHAQQLVKQLVLRVADGLHLGLAPVATTNSTPGRLPSLQYLHLPTAEDGETSGDDV